MAHTCCEKAKESNRGSGTIGQDEGRMMHSLDAPELGYSIWEGYLTQQLQGALRGQRAFSEWE